MQLVCVLVLSQLVHFSVRTQLFITRDLASPPQASMFAHLHICVRDIHGTPCNITISLQNGDTPLMEASRYGHVECVQRLMAVGAQANHQSKVGTVQGWIQGFWKGVVVVWGRILLTS